MVARTLRILRTSIPGTERVHIVEKTIFIAHDSEVLVGFHASSAETSSSAQLESLPLRKITTAGITGLHLRGSLSILRRVEHRRDIGCLKPIFNRFGPHYPLLQFLIAVAGPVLVAGLSYRFLETPFLRLKERFSQLRSAKSPKVTAVASVPVQQS